jgi:MFS family permease
VPKGSRREELKVPATAPVILAGFCAFLNLYATQPLLPLLASYFHRSHADVTLTVTAGTAAVAIAAPFAGQVADRIGRKRVIVASALMLGLTALPAAMAGSLAILIFWRFVQGLATPGVFAITIAYINDEWPAGRAASAVAAYVSGTVLGGFSGRVISGFAAQYLGWRWTFVLLGAAALAISGILARGLPAERFHIGAPHRKAIWRAAAGHIVNPRLAVVYAGSFCVLFTQVALFTYVTFHLAAPPFSLKPGALGLIFCVYLVGAAVTPLAGRAIDRFGHRSAILAACAMCAGGAAISLGAHIQTVLAGLTLASSGVFIANSAATSYIGTAAEHGRALAVGIYVTCYYVGGSFGAAAPGWLWERWGWAGCVGLVICVQAAFAAICGFGFSRRTS